jgi:fructose-bisphosphate aldolase class II
MGVVSPKQMFEKAFSGRYAIGAFNTYNMEVTQAIVEAASESKAPFILQVSPSSFKHAGDTFIKHLSEAAASSGVNFVLHLDHGEDYAIVKKAIDLGFSSVMIDGSKLSKEENIKLTKKVVKYAHARDVWVEAEIGRLYGVEDNISVSEKEAVLTTADEAHEFARATDCDSLAVAVGTSHGVNKSTGKTKPKIYFKRILEIQKKLPKMPIVLHGSSNVPMTVVKMCNKYGGKIKKASGMPDRMISKAAKTHVCKVNIDTDLRLAFTAGVRKSLHNHPENFDPRKYLGLGREEVKKAIIKKFKVLGCAGKA